MRLSKIKLAGFKSFVDPTTVHLPSNLAGVVGPNGSGKSNIIDAVRWVMGESSAKHLRGGSMADVIFSGSSARKPVGQAFVEITFDNTVGKKLGGQYAGYDEIAIKRLVTRDGQSNYYLNGAKCRRRDITDIFLGTGLGPRSYAIIEQGMISRLIEAKPEDLRVMLEEAAGISKYKERRRETENRMRNTHDNLTRINDLREEMDKQLEKLQRQSRTAEKYKVLKQEERKLKGELLALQWRKINSESREKNLLVSQLETALESEIASQRATETSIEKHREAHIEASDVFNEIQGKFYQVGADIASKEQNIQHVKARRNELESDLQQIVKDLQDAGFHQNSDQQRLTELREKIAEVTPRLAEAREKAELSSAQLESAENTLNEWQEAWDIFTQNADEPARLAEVERTKIAHMEAQARQLEKRHLRLIEEYGSSKIDDLINEVTILGAQLAEMQALVDELHENRQACQSKISDLQRKNHEVTEQLSAKRQSMEKLAGRISSLEALQEAALGKADSQLASWLSSRRLETAPRLAQGMEVKAGWEKAIETVLGFHLEAVCVNALTDVSHHIAALSGENVEFISRDIAPENDNGNSRFTPLISQLTTDWPVNAILAGIYCAEDIAEANVMRPQLSIHESVVTKDGIWLGNNWLRINEGKSDQAGVLQREKDLKALQQTLASVNDSIDELVLAQEASKQSLLALESERDEIQGRLRKEERQLSEVRAEHRAKQARSEQLSNRRQRIQVELDELKVQIKANQEDTQAARGRLEAAVDTMDQIEETREKLLSRRDEVRSTLNEVRFAANADARQEQGLELALQSSTSALAATEQNLSRVDQQLVTLNERRHQLETLLKEDENPLASLTEDLEALLKRRVEVESQLADIRRKVEAIDAEMRELSAKKSATEQAVQKAREKLDASRLDAQTLKVRQQTIQEQLVNAGYALEAILEGLSEACEVEVWEQDLAKIAQKIQRLGAINLAAIDEYNEQSERKVHLDSQYSDLIEALETLETAIRKIDKETRQRFKETFDLVNEGLKQKFPKLFGGGQAFLELTGEDMLDTGVSILARPPGKRISNIHLLSGGEKALTAVALVFSIFELNPAPFCMLDEVDAPLDEANVGRFSDLVKAMSDQVQFIFISHNKTTMEIADHLNGVTMHEPGVSRMVSVDVEEAAELAAM